MGTFANQMKAFSVKTKAANNHVVALAFSALAKQIIDKTPVGDPSLWKNPPPPSYEPGTLVNNWFSSVGTPTLGGMRAQDPSAGGSLSQVAAISLKAAGNVVFFQNPTPYAFRIEFEGWSTQAPAGMARVSANNWGIIVSQAARQVQ